jgi:MYXO-CTERM domain-containing protein
MRYVRIAIMAALFMFAAKDAWAADFNVSMSTNPSGMFVWNINGQLNPTLTLVRGHTYTFAVQAPGHPFDIKTAQVTGTADQFNTGVSAQGVTSGTMTFIVPTDPNTPPLFYQCEVHGTMTGGLTLTSTAPAPSAGPLAVTILGLGLGIAGFLALRARRKEALAS